MKRLLTLLFAMLAMVSAWADHWTGPSDGQYPEKMAIAIKPFVNGDFAKGQAIEIAAFMDGEVRGVVTRKTGWDEEALLLPVWGDDADSNKPVTIKAYYNGIVYKLKTTAPFKLSVGNTQTPRVNLYIDAPTGIKFDKVQKSSKVYPATFDLSNETYTLVFENVTGAEVEPMGESEIDNTETQFMGLSGWAVKSAVTVTIDDAGKATFSNYTSPEVAYVYVKANFKTGTQTVSLLGEMQVEALLTVVPVTGISVTPNKVEIPNGYYWSNFVDLFNVTVMPEDATNKSWHIQEGQLIAGPAGAMAGSETIYAVSDDNESIKAPIDVEVYKRVSNINVSKNNVRVPIGTTAAELNDLIKSLYTIEPADAKYANNVAWAWAQPETNFAERINPVENGVVTYRGYYHVSIDAQGEPLVTNPAHADLYIEVYQPVTSITVEPENLYVHVGTSIDEVLDKLTTTILPADADFKDYMMKCVSGQDVLDEGGCMEGTATYQMYLKEFPEMTSNLFTITGFHPANGVVIGQDPLEVYAGTTKDEILENASAGNQDAHDYTIDVRTKNGEELFDAQGGAQPGEYEVEYVITDPDGKEYVVAGTLVVKVKVTAVNVVWAGYPEAAAPVSEWKPNNAYLRVPVGHSIKDMHEAGKYTVNVLPENATNKEVTYMAGGRDVYKNVLNAANTTIQVGVMSKDDNNVYCPMMVEVYNPLQSITAEDMEVTVGTSLNYVMTSVYVTSDPVQGESYTEYAVRYLGSEELGETFTKSGVYQFEVYATDYYLLAPVTAQFKVTVTNPMTDLLVNEEYATDDARKSGELTVELDTDVKNLMFGGVEILPADADNKELAWRHVDGKEVLNGDGKAVADGTGRYEVYAVMNEKLSVFFTVTVMPELAFTVTTTELSKYETKALSITSNLPDEVEAGKLRLVFSNNALTQQPSAVCDNIAASDGTGWTANCRGLATGVCQYTLYYDNKVMAEGNVSVKAEVALESGWQWMAPYAYVGKVGSNNVSIDFNTIQLGDASRDDEYITDLRSQTGLLFNDPEWGVISDINAFVPADGMYKLRTNYAETHVFDLGSNYVMAYQTEGKKVTRRGYNWIAYRQEFDRTFASVKNFLDANNIGEEGDIILGKDGFAQYFDGAWVANGDFAMHAGEGFLYYTEIPTDAVIDFATDDASVLPFTEADKALNDFGVKAHSARRVARAESPWQYDASRFADNMAIVAQMPGVKYAEEWTIGAFVGDECRGKGSFVTDDKMMINVAGKSGEKVTFRMLNTVSGEMFDIDESLTYTQMAGSLKAPVQFSSRLVTGVESINTDAAAEKVYDLTGRRVSTQAKGIVIKNGKVQVNK